VPVKPGYPSDNTRLQLFRKLSREVNASISSEVKDRAVLFIQLKGLLLVLLFLATIYSMWILAGSVWYLLPVFFLGVQCLPLVLNVGHESVHGTFSANPFINRLGTGVFFLLGTSPYFWKLRHISSHHAYTNVKNLDLDIEQSKIIRLSGGETHKWYHRFQAVYMPVMFLFYTLNWFFYRDFKDIATHEFGTGQQVKHPLHEVLFLFAAKIWHFLFLLVIPALISPHWGLVLTGFFLFHFTASFVTAFALISTHIGEDQEIIHTPEDASLPYSWLEHQLKTTADFGTHNSVYLHFFGGFNHHLAHHLFPSVPHLLYPQVTRIITRFCRANDLPYYSYKGLFSCARSHFKRLSKYSSYLND
jgi:linoleoyl-CoA desaturase